MHASVVDIATAQDDMIKLFDAAESDPEVVRADLRSLRRCTVTRVRGAGVQVLIGRTDVFFSCALIGQNNLSTTNELPNAHRCTQRPEVPHSTLQMQQPQRTILRAQIAQVDPQTLSRLTVHGSSVQGEN